jgi:hypothetical protein
VREEKVSTAGCVVRVPRGRGDGGNAASASLAVPVTVRDTYFGLSVARERPAYTRSSYTAFLPLPRTLRRDPFMTRDSAGLWDGYGAPFLPYPL